MSKRHLFWIASWLAIGMSACTTFRPAQRELDTAKACAEWRWIGISRPETQCPDIPGWTVQPLFAQLAPVRQKSEDYCAKKDYTEDYCEEKDVGKVPDPKLIRELNRFCVYEITDPKKRLKDLPFPPAASADLVRFDQDCAAISPSGDEARETEIRRLTELFFFQAGKPKTLTINNRLGVRLAFLDTQPTGIGVPARPGRSHHGYTLAHIARNLVCSPVTSDRCAAQITTQLALPIVGFDAKKRALTERDEINGGRLGMQSDLAEAIRREVDTWRSVRGGKGGVQQHLVLNLSVAWDGELFGGLDQERIAEMKAGTQAVYRALQYAAGFDALVLAAAGNRKDCPRETEGPLLPAAWERGPGNEICPGQDQTAPLLYAVGGVQSQGEPIFNARLRGMPRRAAYAENAVVPSLDPDNPSTAIYTGTSVATAVVSSIAAIVWDTRPELTAQGVMDLLDKSGDVPGLKADFWFDVPRVDNPPPLVHRLSLCTALKAACASLASSASCPIPIGTECDDWEPSKPIHSTLASNPLPACSCQPWVGPQPEDPPCPLPDCPGGRTK